MRAVFFAPLIREVGTGLPISVVHFNVRREKFPDFLGRLEFHRLPRTLCSLTYSQVGAIHITAARVLPGA
jgi:hypothetical protein